MSADDAYAVWEQDGKWMLAHVFMSCIESDCAHLREHTPKKTFPKREHALASAHDSVKQEFAEGGVVEYGGIEFDIEPEGKFCGRCFTCVHERNIIDPNLEKCDRCKTPLFDWRFLTPEGTFCRSCERER